MFSDAEATSLVTHIIKVSDWGFPFATTDMRYVAKSYLDSCGRTAKCSKNNVPASEWARSFLIWDILTSWQSPEVIRTYLRIWRIRWKYDETLMEPSLIFHYDETNLTDDPGVVKCIFRRGMGYAIFFVFLSVDLVLYSVPYGRCLLTLLIWL